MAQEHFFDIVSKIDLQEVSNAVQQAMKEMAQRFDFKGSKSNIELDRSGNEIHISSDDEYRLKSVIDILQGKLVKRKVPLRSLTYGKVEPSFSGTMKQSVSLQQGIPAEKAREIVKIIKNTKLKVQSEIQKDQLRIKSKKIDDLQSMIKLLKDQDFGIHMDFVNYR